MLPTFAVTSCTPGLWLRAPEFGVDFGKLVHAEQAATFHAPLAGGGRDRRFGAGRTAGGSRPGRGAVVALEREIRDAASGTLYCTLRQTLFLRGDGGFGGAARAEPALDNPGTRNRTRAPNSPSIRARR